MAQTVSQDPRIMLRRAKAVLICPRVFKAGFFVGGEGGSCVLLARSGNGTWSYPTFYDIGSGSFGFQFGVEDSQLMLMIMTNRGLNAVMDSQVGLAPMCRSRLLRSAPGRRRGRRRPWARISSRSPRHGVCSGACRWRAG